MPLTDPMPILNRARQNGYCVGAFNVVDFMTVEAVVSAAEMENAPVIVQTSSGTIKAFGIGRLVAMTRIAAEAGGVPVILHLDHGKNLDVIFEAVRGGYNSVMIDGSEYPFDENIAITKKVVDEAHAHGVAVEGEIGVVAGVEDEIVVRQDSAIYTTPEEAIEFQERSGVDFLAAAIGTAHGFYKTAPRLDIDTLREIRKKTDYPLVVHGGTGLSEETVRQLVKAGACKFNVSTQVKQTYIDSMYDYINRNRTEYNILKVLAHAKEALIKMIAGYIRLLGSSGKA
jgi:fructose-bisphosphate aldolase class II